jgi:hypothetical protein
MKTALNVAFFNVFLKALASTSSTVQQTIEGSCMVSQTDNNKANKCVSKHLFFYYACGMAM